LTGARPPADPLQAARARAFRLLAVRDRSRRELAERLGPGYPKDVVEAVLDAFTRDGYLDDARLARRLSDAWVRERNFGPMRIRRELARRGLAPVADAAPDPLAVQEAALRAARRSLKGKAEPADPGNLRRMAGYLERRGFPADTIRAIVRRTRQGELWSDP